jgi:dienelactone hydrolase
MNKSGTMKKLFIIVGIAVLYFNVLLAQQNKSINIQVTESKGNYELTGNLSFDVSSSSGLVRSVAVTIGDGGTGTYKAIMNGDTTLPTHTIYRPMNLSAFGPELKLPIVVWANGGCRNGSGEFRNFLSEIASHGFLVIAIGPVNNSLTSAGDLPFGGTDSNLLLDAIDWAVAENIRLGSSYFNKIDVGKIALMGQSCGGMQVLDVLKDSRVTTIVLWNSGIFAGNAKPVSAFPEMNMPSIPKSDLQKLHCSIAFFVGGESDGATINATDDFTWIKDVPAVLAKYDFSDYGNKPGSLAGYGHYPATYKEPNGGDFAVAGVSWLKWQLKGDIKAGKMFTGQNPELISNKHWTMERTNID